MEKFKKKIFQNKPTNRLWRKKMLWVMICIGAFFAVLISCSFASAIVWDNIAYWKMEDQSEEINSSYYNLTAFNPASGAPAFITGKIDLGSYHNATNNVGWKITKYNSDLNFNQSGANLTISFWFNVTSTASQMFIDHYNASKGWLIMKEGDKIRATGFNGTDNNIWTKNNINTNTWQMITITKNSSNVCVFINATDMSCSPNADYNILVPVNNNLTIGLYFAGGNIPLNGMIDELGIWKRALSVSEINELWNNGAGLEFSASAISVSLDSPPDASLFSTSAISFNASFIATNYNLTNATMRVWKGSDIFNNTVTKIITGTSNSTTWNIANFVQGDYKWNVYACGNNTTGSLCSFAPNNFTFEWRPFEIISQSFVNYAYETEYQRFNLSITTIPEILSVTSKLNYNGTLYNGVTSCSAGNCDIYSQIDIPLISVENINKSFYWQIIVYDGTSSYTFNTTEATLQQNVTRIHLEECSGTYTIKTLNFTTYQETNLTRINPFYIGGTFNTWLGSGTVKRNQSFNKPSTSNLSLCLLPTAKTQFTDAQIEYSFENENLTYIPRNYYFQNASLTNLPQEVFLYLLEAEDSTTFIIKVQDQKLSAVESALVYIQRYYPSDGLFRAVQIAKTDSNGETVGFYEVEITDYKHLITKNGAVLLETTQQKVVGKDVPYTLTFTVGEALGFPWAPWIADPNIQTSLTYNKTSNIVTFTYIDVTGTVTLGRLVVVEESMNNYTSTTIWNSSSTQSSATLICNMTGYEGNFIAYGYIETEVSNLLNFIITTAREIFGREGLLIGMFIIMVSGFAFMWNPTAGVVSINAAVIFTNIIGFISVSPIFIFGLIAVSLIAIILLKT